MKELTSDMVWMVKREVTLKDGSKKEVLVPQVYVVGRNTDIDSRGAVISANDVIMNIKGDVQNSGVISGRNLTGLAANNIENLGGRLQGRELYLVAKNMLNNLGGELNATDHLVAQGKHINIESTTSETENTPDFYQKSLTQQASVKVGNDNKKGSASFIATENITVKGANVDVNGNVVFSAGKALNFGTVETENKEHYVPNADNYYKLDQKQEVGSQLNVTGNLDAVGKSAVEMRGVSVTSNGTMNVLSDGNINIQEARYKEQLSSASKSKSRGLTSSTTEVYRHKHDYDVAEASNLDADKIYLHSSKGNVTIQGSNVAAGNGLTVKGKNIDIREAENRVYSDDFYSKKKSGMLGAGIGVAFGTQKQTTESDQTKLYAQSSQVGSLKGNTTMIAEQSYAQTASTVKAIEGDVNILAQKAEIKAADNKYETNTKQTFQQKGVTISLSSPVISAIQGVAKSAEMIGKSKHARVNAMTAANSAYNVVQAGQALGELAGAASGAGQAAGGSTGLKISITYGQQQSESRTHTVGNTAAKSQVNAGGKVNIIATGAGKASNIDVVGSDIWGKQGTTLIADNQVNIKAAEQTHQERSTNKSSGFNAGVAIDIGKGVSAGLTVGGNYGKGYGNGDETTYVASHVGDSQSKTVINAGGDVTLAGSQVKGKRVELDAENLNIESLQDKSSYHGKQMNMQGSVTIGYGFSASAGFSKSKINSEHASVNEQAGIYAGDEGYDVNVKNHTDLKGAIITSTQQAESLGLNQFSTGTLSHSDIENHSSYKGSSIGISAKGDANGGWTGQEKNGISGSVGYGRESDNQNSVTKSGINTQNIEIRNENAQQARTGQSITETLAAIKTDISTDNAESQSGKLENRFDKNALQKELNIQVEATKGFVQTANAAGNAIANKLGEEAVAKQREAQAAQEVADRAYKANPSKENETALNTANQNLITANNEADKWQTGGEYKRKIDGAMNAISAALGGLPAAGIATSALSPEINHQIKLATEGSPMANKVAHAVWGAVEAYSANQNAAAGAGGALASEVMADVIAKELYGKKPSQLNREEKEVVSSVSQAAGALVGGVAANSSQGIGVGLTTAKNAVENNFLSDASRARLNALKTKYHRGEKLTNKEKLEFRDLIESDQRSDILLDKFRKDPNSLNSKEREAFLSYVDRYYIETVTGNTASGYKLASPTSLVNAQNRFESEYLINDPVPKRDYGHFPFAGTDAQRSQAVNTLPEESKNWLGWRSEKHSRDEEMYYTVKNELDASENYKNSANGKIAYSVKDGLESASMIYGVGVLSNALSKLPATVNTLNLPNKVVSATAKVGDFAKAHPILTEKVVNSGTSMGFTYLGNSLSGKETSMSDLAWSAGTGFVAGGTKFGTTLAINSVSGGVQGYFEENDEPVKHAGYKAASSGIATLVGGGIGKGIEKLGFRVLVGNVSRNKDYYEPLYRNQKFYNLLNEEYKYIPTKIGTIGDSLSSEYINNKLEKNEPKINSWLKGGNDAK